MAALFQDLYFAILITTIVGAGGIVLVSLGSTLPRKGNRPRLRFGWMVLLLAGMLAIATPVGLMVELPIALSQDNPNSPSAVSSFFGSCSSNASSAYCGVNTTQTWAPSLGWYLSFAGGGLLGVSALLGSRAVRGRKSGPPVP